MDELLAAYVALPAEPDPVNALRALVHFHIRFHVERSEEVFIAYMELRNLTEENFVTIEALRREYERHLETLLTRGVDAGAFAVVDPRIAAMAIIAMLNGVNTWYREGGRLSLPQVQELYWDMVRKSVLA